MKPSIAACLALFAGSMMTATALAADNEPLPDDIAWQAQFHSTERTYFREHRLRAYERTRIGMRQGATCVTPKGVCWIAEPLSSGNSCSCESRRSGAVYGTVGG